MLAPWRTAAPHAVLERIGRSATLAELEAATADPLFDYSAPTDRRPYYFNMLRPRALFALDHLSRSGAIGGNLQATLLLLALMAICTVFVLVIIVWPLAAAGRPPMPWTEFAVSMVYFAGIGFGYMLIQIGLLQRFSVYIGHPTYTLAIVLFSMLLFTGAGSFLSGPCPCSRSRRASWVPVGIAIVLSLTATVLPVDARRHGHVRPRHSHARGHRVRRTLVRSSRHVLSDWCAVDSRVSRGGQSHFVSGRSRGSVPLRKRGQTPCRRLGVGRERRVQRAGVDRRGCDLDVDRDRRQLLDRCGDLSRAVLPLRVLGRWGTTVRRVRQVRRVRRVRQVPGTN